RISLVDSLASKEYKYEDENYNLSTGGSKTYSYSIESTNTPLKITLVWTDYPGSTTASKALVNDLDLKVTSPSGIVYYGNDFTSPYNTAYDRLNNVENVFIDTPELGTYTIEIMGYNVPNGSQPFSLFSSGDFGIASGDTTLPTCSITAPSNGATVSNSVTYSATASDNVGVSRVDFLVDGAVVGTDSTSPYSVSWDTTAHSNGSRTLQAKAYDAAGNVGSSSTISVTVDNVVTSNDVTEEFSGYVSKTGTADNYFYIDVTATGDIDLTLNWASSDDLDMYLYNPAGTEVKRAYTLNNPETISYTATTIGTYEIKVSAYSGSESFYLTATHPVNPSETAHLESTDYISTYKDYYITVGDSGTINVELSWSGSADMDIFLYNPSGSEVARAYTLRNPESISYLVSTNGTYRIRVDSYSGTATCTVKSNYPQ
ncbi:MAG: pre-peptidase C-terminal domain-containing protein, partial [Halanaerobiales bacterium]|nr:pre-peptidase C-terminal domain-containing protein [Halanaerobiales bacterium]